MSIYDECTVERQKYFYKVYNAQLYTIEDVFNAWILDDQYLTNTLLRIRVKINDLRLLTYQIKNTIYKNLPYSFSQAIHLYKCKESGWGNRKSNKVINISVGRFLKFYGLSFKAIVSSLKAYIFCMWEQKIGNDVRSLKLWSLTDMMEIISSAPEGFSQWETKRKALYIASDFNVLRLKKVKFIEKNFDYKNFSKTRIFTRLRKVLNESYLYYYSTKDKSICCDYFLKIMTMSEKEFSQSFDTLTDYYYQLTSTFSSSEKIDFDGKVYLLKDYQPLFHIYDPENLNVISSLSCWGERQLMMKYNDYEEDLFNFFHIYDLYKCADTEIDKDIDILLHSEIIRILWEERGEKETVKFLGEIKKKIEEKEENNSNEWIPF